ncbi:MAG: cell division protein FtsZ [Candidatus Heimdallarchaeaceae archaeon]
MTEHFTEHTEEKKSDYSTSCSKPVKTAEKSSPDVTTSDEELLKLLQTNSSSSSKYDSINANAEIGEFIRDDRILAIGVGGAGSNAINNIIKRGGIEGATTIAINTDARHLLNTKAEKKLLIGKELTRGTGAGNDPNIGHAAAVENEDEIRELVRGSDLVFIACGLGKGTGTGAGPYVAKIAQEEGCLVVSVCTLPFASEGQNKMNTALRGLHELDKHSNTIIIVPNEKLVWEAPDFSLLDAFALADDVLINAVVGLTDLIVHPAMVNVDFADTKKILRNSGPAVISVGRGRGENRALDAINSVLTNSLLEADISKSTGALVNIKANKKISTMEVEAITNEITSRIDPKATFIWGLSIDETMADDEIAITVVIAEVDSPYLDVPDEEMTIETLWYD